jgi:hypothetical protein
VLSVPFYCKNPNICTNLSVICVYIQSDYVAYRGLLFPPWPVSVGVSYSDCLYKSHTGDEISAILDKQCQLFVSDIDQFKIL